MTKFKKVFLSFTKTKINYQNIIVLLISIVSLSIAYSSLIVARKVYVLTSIDYIPEIEFQITGEPPYCSWPEIKDRQLIITNKNNDVYKIQAITVLGVETVGFEDYNSSKAVEIPLVHIAGNLDYYYNEKSPKRIVLDFKDVSTSQDNELLYNRIKNKIKNDYSYLSGPNPKGAALPYLQTCYYYINIEYEDKFQNIKSICYKYYHIEGIGYRKNKISSEEYNDFIDKLNSIPWQSDFDTLWQYLTKVYSYQLPTFNFSDS